MMAEKSANPIIIYTDGACSGNPGPGGYGVILISGKHRKELSGGFAKTTNNRMEMMAVIEGLRALKQSCQVTLFSDSKYVVDAINQGWALRWQANNWKRNKREKALNVDLWQQLLPLLDQHTVEVRWVKGHADDRDNQRADQLAVKASLAPNLPPDRGYENPVEPRTTSLF